MYEKVAAAVLGLAMVSASSMALARPTVVIDPGHGGANPGAPGVMPGVLEKDVTLAIAHRVAEGLEARGIDVILTREGDDNLSLRLRAARANAVGADAFVSIHTNASADHDVRGFETFVLSSRAASVQASALRAAAGDVRPGIDPEIAAIIRDVERNLAIDNAADLAATIQQHLGEVRGKALDRGVRRGAMHVLFGATMPAVLVEVGFIDHPVEGRKLAQAATRDQIGDAIAAAIAKEVVASANASSR